MSNMNFKILTQLTPIKKINNDFKKYMFLNTFKKKTCIITTLNNNKDCQQQILLKLVKN